KSRGPVEHLESLPGQGAEPEEEGNVGVLSELAGPAGEVEERLLEDVGVVEPALEAAVQPYAYHPPQPLAVAVPELAEGVLIPGRTLPQQWDGVVRVFHRRGVHTLGTAEVRRPSTGCLEFSSDRSVSGGGIPSHSTSPEQDDGSRR